MLDLLERSLKVYSQIRDSFYRTIESCRSTDEQYASYAYAQMSFYSSRCISLNILLQEGMLWDCEIIMRSALECATKFLYVSAVSGPEREARIIECVISLNEIEDISRSDKASTAANNSVEDNSGMLLRGAILPKEREEKLREKWPKNKRHALKQKWSFTELVRELKQVHEETLDLRGYDSLLHSYGLSSHLIHADQTALNLDLDRKTRPAPERMLLERAHFARLSVEQTTLLFLCCRAMEHSLGVLHIPRETVQELLELQAASSSIHREFAESQSSFYEELGI